MAKKKVTKQAVSRRTVKTTKTGTKKKTTKKKVPVSKEVAQTMALIQSFSARDMKYYEQVREIVNNDQKDTILRQHKIGTLLRQAQTNNPKSQVATNIVLAVGISPAMGRYYRKFAERVGKEELEMYTTLTNEKLGWKIPFDTIYKIVEKWDSREDRMRIAKAVVRERMSSTTMLERFPINDRAEDPDAVRTVSIKSGIRKLQDLMDKELKQYDNVLSSFNGFDDVDQLLELGVLAGEGLDLTTEVEQKREAVKDLFEQLSSFTEGSDADEVIALINQMND